MGSDIGLEPEQEASILGICASPYGAYLLTGPAGSGKTFVLTSAEDNAYVISCMQDKEALDKIEVFVWSQY